MIGSNQTATSGPPTSRPPPITSTSAPTTRPPPITTTTVSSTPGIQGSSYTKNFKNSYTIYSNLECMELMVFYSRNHYY